MGQKNLPVAPNILSKPKIYLFNSMLNIFSPNNVRSVVNAQQSKMREKNILPKLFENKSLK